MYKVGLLTTGTDLRMTLRRAAGRYTLTVENLTAGGASTLTTRHPAFLDGERDLYVGLFGANTQSDQQRTLDRQGVPGHRLDDRTGPLTEFSVWI